MANSTIRNFDPDRRGEYHVAALELRQVVPQPVEVHRHRLVAVNEIILVPRQEIGDRYANIGSDIEDHARLFVEIVVLAGKYLVGRDQIIDRESVMDFLPIGVATVTEVG